MIDFRSQEDFTRRHLCNSTSLPWKQFDERAHELPPKFSSFSVLAYAEDATLICEDLKLKNYFIKDLYIDSEEFWNTTELAVECDIFKSTIVWIPSPCLMGVIDTIESIRKADGLPANGTALDLACGSARDGIFLAIRGWKSHNIDYIPLQIEKAKHLAEVNSVHSEHLANFYVMDVAKEISTITDTFKVDLVNVSRYLNRSIFPNIKSMVNPGGFVVFHTFMEGCSKPKKIQFKLRDGELRKEFSDFEIIEDKIYNISDGRPTSWFCARKPKHSI